MEDAKGICTFGHTLIWIDQQQEPAVSRYEPAPENRRQIGARNLRQEVQWPLAPLRMLRGNRPRPFDVLGHHRQAPDP